MKTSHEPETNRNYRLLVIKTKITKTIQVRNRQRVVNTLILTAAFNGQCIISNKLLILELSVMKYSAIKCPCS